MSVDQVVHMDDLVRFDMDKTQRRRHGAFEHERGVVVWRRPRLQEAEVTWALYLFAEGEKFEGPDHYFGFSSAKTFFYGDSYPSPLTKRQPVAQGVFIDKVPPLVDDILLARSKSQAAMRKGHQDLLNKDPVYRRWWETEGFVSNPA